MIKRIVAITIIIIISSSIFKGIYISQTQAHIFNPLNTKHPPIRDFKLNENMLREVTKGVSEKYWHWFAASHSIPHLLQIRKQALADMARTRRLDSPGWSGVGLRIFANIIDPVLILAVIFTVLVGNAIIYKKKISKSGNIVYGALLGGAVMGLVKTFIIITNPHQYWTVYSIWRN